MNHLTKQEQFVLGVVVLLLVTGWMVRAYRQAHPPNPADATTPAAVQKAK